VVETGGIWWLPHARVQGMGACKAGKEMAPHRKCALCGSKSEAGISNR